MSANETRKAEVGSIISGPTYMYYIVETNVYI